MPTPPAPKPGLPKSLEVFSSVDDPRRAHPTTLHKLTDIIALTIMATLGGASNWVENEAHGVLDVAMDEALNRSRVGNSAQNLAFVLKLVLNLLRAE